MATTPMSDPANTHRSVVGCGECACSEKATALAKAGDEMATWLDYYANVHKESSVGDYAEIARQTIDAWERLVPSKDG